MQGATQGSRGGRGGMKRVAIIGNAPITADHGRWVNESDFVVRFNEAENYLRNSGARVDALCVTNLCDPGRRFFSFRGAGRATGQSLGLILRR